MVLELTYRSPWQRLSLDRVEEIFQDLFHKYDQHGNSYLVPMKFKALMTDLHQRWHFPQDEILLFLAEADMNADGMIEYRSSGHRRKELKELVESIFSRRCNPP